MCYPRTSRICTTRDVIWLNRLYFSIDIEEGVTAGQTMGIDMEKVNKDEDAEEIANEDEHKDEDEASVNEMRYGTTRSGAKLPYYCCC
jgi:hypothetical protein